MSEMARLPRLCIIFQAFQAQSIKLLPNSNVRNKAYHISSIIIGIFVYNVIVERKKIER